MEGRKRVRSADSLMAEIKAERLVRHLERSGFVLMKRPAGAAPTTAGMFRHGTEPLRAALTVPRGLPTHMRIDMALRYQRTNGMVREASSALGWEIKG